MRAFDPEVGDVIWAAIVPLVPVPAETHPLGCHRPRSPDRDCFDVMVVRLGTGCSWEDAERLCGNKVSDTTARARRDEWIAAGVFDAIANEAIAAYDRLIGLDLSDVGLDSSLHKSPCGGEGTGPNPTDRAKLGWKWSMLTDRFGIPIGWTVDGANRNDSILLAPTLDDAAGRILLAEIDTLWLDRGYDSQVTLDRLAARNITDPMIAKKRKRGAEEPVRKNQPMGLRWRSSEPTRGCRTSGIMGSG
jgi:transposase